MPGAGTDSMRTHEGLCPTLDTAEIASKSSILINVLHSLVTTQNWKPRAEALAGTSSTPPLGGREVETGKLTLSESHTMC